ncbi:2-dehydro-3-deoxyphosphogluconate aldolase/(4S)-4-hydroxy-2-oxoglutarate aldolase [Mycobacterium frederiksbergense]|uniref:2-dehydro-3-deoxyphosphogluconate aldolase/(4S)-4-hydroxy-2-oxoglutarate aldolase n=1 Tax=Mycolicibacterium frederiksbergense TaxID=117567 RepID=A0ABT6L777_9MYCO|nr:bifunctional 4-hydroxy-2-oxoglutarate aldolase/2-dehydro-3-deoxy-phosphogluconate aldolase [Mycolicibacterium frederiksbergense]MDH6197825.1 2-dehydro-3-deoxyphosphogluconate aldolase/(4S)-4-hydroxy-2-oxoglutarate aldolase [Mycolicibacterium frederiksbergense]
MTALTSAILAQRIIGIIRCAEASTARNTANAMLDAGLRTLEITLTTPGALDLITELATRHPDAAIGAGTVLNAGSVGAVANAGGAFVVSPNVDGSVIAAARRLGLVSFPGAATPTEALNAIALGADAAKIFPACNLTPRWINDVRTSMPHIDMIPTGGIDVENAREWIDAGAVAVGMGSALTRGEPAEVKSRVQRLLKALGDRPRSVVQQQITKPGGR